MDLERSLTAALRAALGSVEVTNVRVYNSLPSVLLAVLSPRSVDRKPNLVAQVRVAISCYAADREDARRLADRVRDWVLAAPYAPPPSGVDARVVDAPDPPWPVEVRSADQPDDHYQFSTSYLLTLIAVPS